MLVDAEGLVEKRYIEPGQLEEDNMRVVLEGLEAGERFITQGPAARASGHAGHRRQGN